MGFDHSIAEERVAFLRPIIEHTASMVNSGKRRDRSAGCDEFSKEVKVSFDGMTEHESVDLKESGSRVLTLEKKQTFSLYWTPK
ncbi:hypothetical protein CCACVL1_19404 [Corchorus capsularis]|uniref:Uncharacterized protein n=1 Tax=Corchorus capsularis TaxID=210143 RepID=A0A1R3HGZ3_COCAP|nr:hypothetical protein CCACVL1_19404 [Corchorus capsularis]